MYLIVNICKHNGTYVLCILFRFPKDIVLRKKWILATKRLNFVPSNHSFICAKHFHQADFETHCEITKLKKDAVPSIFDFPEHLKRKVNLMRTGKRTRTRHGETNEQEQPSTKKAKLKYVPVSKLSVCTCFM